MIRRNQRILNAINCITDFVLTAAAYALAVLIRYELFHGIYSYDPFDTKFVWIILLYAVAVVCAYFIAGLYRSFRFKRVGAENLKIIIINAVAVAVLMAVYFMAHVDDASRWMLVLFWMLSSALIIAKRAIVRSSLQSMRRTGKNLKHVIIAGSGRLAQQFVSDIKEHPEYGIWIDGYVAAAANRELDEAIVGSHSAEAQKTAKSAYLGEFDQLPVLLTNDGLDSLIVALEPQDISIMPQVLNAADKEGTRVELIPFYNDYIPSNPVIEPLGKSKLIDLRSTALDNLGWAAIKRFVDIVGSLILIIITSPLMIICAIGVKLSSPGPVFFKQERIGKNKKPFTMLKFRSMKVNAAQDSAWSTNEDPRKTRFGSFIRKYSIDEIPQFFNVLVGDMSLVGPRPEIPFHVSHFKEDVPRYLVRQQVRPGITGWAQIHGLRGDTSIEDRVEYDIWYIENWSPGLDIRILWDTVFGGKFKNEEIR